MKLATLSFTEARQRHPKEVNAILAKLRLGKSKHKSVKGSKLKWEYQCAVTIEGSGTFADLLAGKFEADRQRREAMTLDERVADEVRRTSTALHGSIGHWWGSQPIPNPPEVEARAREAHSKDMREKAEFDALPKEEKERQREELLGQLRGKPGFMEIHIDDGDT